MTVGGSGGSSGGGLMVCSEDDDSGCGVVMGGNGKAGSRNVTVTTLAIFIHFICGNGRTKIGDDWTIFKKLQQQKSMDSSSQT